MGFLTKLLNQDKNGNLIDVLTLMQNDKLAIKKNAIEHAIDLIAKTISKCEFEYYQYNSESKKLERKKNNDTYYRLNIKPNDNEIATTFIYNVVAKLLKEEEALIISINKKIYLAESFKYSSSILKEKEFYDINLVDCDNNKLKLDKTYYSSECVYLNLGLSEIRQCLDDYYSDIGKLISIQDKKYINANLQKWKLTIPGTQPKLMDPKTNQPLNYEQYKKKITDGLLDTNDAIIMLSNDFGLDKLSSNEKYNSDDLLRLEEKWEKEVAMAFNIPTDVFYGSKTDKSTGTTDFITFAVLPVTAILEDGLNGALIKKDDFFKGNMIRINKLNIKHFDIFDCASSIDKLLSSGFSHDENRYFLGIPETGEEWAQVHHITKNYGNVSETLGGDKMG